MESVYPFSLSCASTTAIAATFTMSFTSAPRCSTCTGLLMPIRIGPIGFGAADARQQFVGDVAGFEIGKDQNVGPAFQRAERIIAAR